MILANFGFVEIGLTDLGLLLFGVFFGFLIAFILYLLSLIASLRTRKHIVDPKSTNEADLIVKDIIVRYQTIFLDKELQGSTSDVVYCKEQCEGLVKDISRAFFPNTKRPLMELSIDESLMLSLYVSKRINDILRHKGIRFIKKLRISTIMGFTEVKKVVDLKVVKKTRSAVAKAKVLELFKTVSGILNVVNPIYWAKKIVLGNTIKYATRKICKLMIVITAEETYKIYSKSVFKDEVIIVGAEDFQNELVGGAS